MLLSTLRFDTLHDKVCFSSLHFLLTQPSWPYSRSEFSPHSPRSRRTGPGRPARQERADKGCKETQGGFDSLGQHFVWLTNLHGWRRVWRVVWSWWLDCTGWGRLHRAGETAQQSTPGARLARWRGFHTNTCRWRTQKIGWKDCVVETSLYCALCATSQNTRTHSGLYNSSFREQWMYLVLTQCLSLINLHIVNINIDICWSVDLLKCTVHHCSISIPIKPLMLF